jgi:hypothetical protein
MGCIISAGGIDNFAMRLTTLIEDKIKMAVQANVEAERPV